MIHNAMGGETFTLFGFTIQYFERSVRAKDIVLTQPNMYGGFAENATHLLRVFLFQLDGYTYMDLIKHGSNYLFAMPLIIVGVAGFFSDRISKGRQWLTIPEPVGSPTGEPGRHARWGMLLMILWLLAAAWSSLVTREAHLGRAAILMYPTILMIAYGIYIIGKRRRLLAVALAAIFALGAVRFTGEYFSEGVQHKLGRFYYAGLVEAMEACRGRPYDTLYITQTRPEENQYGIPEKVLLEYALRLDPKYVRESMPMADPDGRVWQPFGQRYRLAAMDKLRIDPEAEALYVIFDADREFFDLDAFDFESFGDYCLVTPHVLQGQAI
jgi:hypothetical protein